MIDILLWLFVICLAMLFLAFTIAICKSASDIDEMEEEWLGLHGRYWSKDEEFDEEDEDEA